MKAAELQARITKTIAAICGDDDLTLTELKVLSGSWDDLILEARRDVCTHDGHRYNGRCFSCGMELQNSTEGYKP